MRSVRIVAIFIALVATASVLSAQPTYNVKNYGAVGNGSDATAAFQAAVTAASAGGGGEIMVPAGRYGLSAPLHITTPAITLVGEGPGASVIISSAATGDVVAFGNTSTAISPCGGMRGLSIKSSVARTSGAALTIDGCQQGEFQHLELATTGGDGIHLSPTGHLCAILHFSDLHIIVTGAFNGILVQGGNDRYFRSAWITGNMSPGSRGINIQFSGGDWYTDIESVGFEYGVLINPGTGQGVTWGHMVNVLTDSNTSQGYRITSSGGYIWGMTFTAPWASSNGFSSANGRGFYINAGSAILIESPRVINNGGHGIEIAGGTSVKIIGGVISSNSQQSHGTFDAINVNSSAGGFQIIGTTAGFGGVGGPTQRYGLSIASGSDNFLVQGADFTGNLTGAVQVTPGASATRRFLGDLPYNSALEKASSP
jgi:hypothetical protein